MAAAETQSPPESLPTLLMPVAGDRCANCGAQLASDQRYCLECGERRGGVALPVARPSATSARESTVAEPRRSGPPPGATLIAGVGTLLLAIGVGVLIGRAGHDGSNAKAPAAQIITVSGGGSATTTTSASTTPAAGATPTTHAKAGKKASHSAAANSVAATSKNGTVQKTKGKVVTVGSKGHGPGYQNGKFTGNFFGP
jgi:hypothetical protein